MVTRYRSITAGAPRIEPLPSTTSPEIVSSDLVGAPRAGVVDVHATIGNGRNAVQYVWYDNEYGYSRQVVRLVERVCGLRPPTYPR